jgi:hypothetical protein
MQQAACFVYSNPQALHRMRGKRSSQYGTNDR